MRWDADPNVLYYEVLLRTGDGKDVETFKATEGRLALNLVPGEYRYRIRAFNVLRKPELELPWQEFVVLKAEIPRVARIEPKLRYVEDADASLTLWGECLVPGARVELRCEDPSAAAIEGIETARLDAAREGAARLRAGADETCAVRFAFPAEAFRPGRYAVLLTNPGGLAAEIPAALVVRHKLAEPRSLVPAPGSVFGPAELRGKAGIGFSWEPVPEAARYVFCLYPSGAPERPVRREVLAGTAYRLDDLAALDRGEFRWSVEAQGIDGEGGLVPAIRAATADFRIDLPPPVAPDLTAAGDVFYGR